MNIQKKQKFRDLWTLVKCREADHQEFVVKIFNYGTEERISEY